LNGKVTVQGIQGHVAYPDSVANPIHMAAPALAALADEVWDTGNAYYPPSSLQISNIQSGTGATNVVPGELTALFNIRFNTEQTEAVLRSRVEEIFQQHGLETEFQWQLSGPPFLTVNGALTAAVQAAVLEETGLETELSTSGGTSDGRFISPWDGAGEARVEVVELGPINATIHKINECVAINDLAPLARIYEGIAVRLLKK
jgi:succinyl-diaminopimelate desuccinylase